MNRADLHFSFSKTNASLLTFASMWIRHRICVEYPRALAHEYNYSFIFPCIQLKALIILAQLSNFLAYKRYRNLSKLVPQCGQGYFVIDLKCTRNPSARRRQTQHLQVCPTRKNQAKCHGSPLRSSICNIFTWSVLHIVHMGNTSWISTGLSRPRRCTVLTNLCG
jgi:hypothetical protein